MRVSILTVSIELENLPPVPIVNVKKNVRFPLRTAAKRYKHFVLMFRGSLLVMAIKSLYVLKHVYLSKEYQVFGPVI